MNDEAILRALKYADTIQNAVLQKTLNELPIENGKVFLPAVLAAQKNISRIAAEVGTPDPHRFGWNFVRP